MLRAYKKIVLAAFVTDWVFCDNFRAGWLSNCEREGDGS